MANKTTSEKNKPTRKTLRADEYYNPKTKRYEYHYKDALGKERVVSSYRLEPTDQLPKGKRSGKSLREKEAELKVQLENNIDIDGAKLTLLEVIDRYLNHLYNRKELAHNTKAGYSTTVKTLAQYKLGHMEIGKIKPEHCEEWLSDMKKKHRGSSIQSQISLIKRSFEYAIDYDYIVKNPFRRITTDRSDSKKMEAIPIPDMQRFLDFCSKDAHSAHCYDMIYVLFWTGLRASELCGLTLDNIDMENHLIRVEKQLQCINHTHVVLPTKTINGTRYIPMTDDVYECFQRILKIVILWVILNQCAMTKRAKHMKDLYFWQQEVERQLLDHMSKNTCKIVSRDSIMQILTILYENLNHIYVGIHLLRICRDYHQKHYSIF